MNNSGGISCEIYLESETLRDSTMFFNIGQDSECITVSLECLENLLACANEMLQAWRETRSDENMPNGRGKPTAECGSA